MRYPCALLLLCLGLVGCQQTQPRPEIVPPEYVGLLAPKTPAPLLQNGTVAWGDWLVLALYAAVPLSVAAWQFARRDLAGG